MNDINDIFDRLKGINDKVLTAHGIKSRPSGQEYCLLVLELAHAVIMDVSPADLTDDLLNYLTVNNCHTMRQACELAKDLLKKEGFTV